MADFNKYYRAFVLMQETLKGDFTHNYIESNLKDADKGKDVLSGKNYSRVIDMDWVEAIEDAIPYIDKAIREQRRFIIQNEDIVPIEKARKITNESVRHLAQHTNLIARVEGDDVTPERILDIQREESFAIYENRFLRTLLVHTSRFVDERYKEMKHAPNDSYQKIQISRQVQLHQQKLEFELSYSNESHEEKEFDINADISTLTDFQRVRRIRRVLADFSASPLIRTLTSSELVRPPIQRTNLMTKNPNFKKALDLWLFIESYKKTGFEIVGKEYTGEMDKEVQLAMYNVMSYEHFVISIATNPALRKLLHEKYLEENARLEKDALRPEEQIIAETEARIAKVREEETAIRLEEIRTREKQINDLNSQLNHSKFTLRQYEAKMTEMKGLINLHETTIQTLKDNVFELEKEVSLLKDKIEEQNTQIATQAATITAQTAEIVSLKSQLEEKNAEIAKHLETIAEAKSAIEKLSLEYEKALAENENLRATVSEKEQDIENLKKTTEELREELYQKAEETGLLKNTLESRNQEIEKQSSEIAALKAELGDTRVQLEEMTSQHKQEVADLTKSHNEDKEQMYLSFRQQTDKLNSAHTDELKKVSEKLKAEASREVSALKDSFEKERTNHNKAIDNLKKQNQKAIDAEHLRYEKELEKIKRDYDRKLQRQSRRYKSELEKAKHKFKAEAQAEVNSALDKIKAQREADELLQTEAKHLGSSRLGIYIRKK